MYPYESVWFEAIQVLFQQIGRFTVGLVTSLPRLVNAARRQENRTFNRRLQRLSIHRPKATPTRLHQPASK